MEEVYENDLRDHLSNSFSALAVSRRQNGSGNNQEEKVLQQIEDGEQELAWLRKQLAEYSVKEARIRNEKHSLESRISMLRNAFDHQQQDLVEATSKAIAYRQEILEENVRLAYALQAAQEEKSIFVSSLLPILEEFSLHPTPLDAHSIVSNLRILFKHYKETLAITEERLKDSRFQPILQLDSHMKEQPLDDDSPHQEWNHSSYAPGAETVDSKVEREREREKEPTSTHFLPSIIEEEHSSSCPDPDDTEDDEDDEDNSSDYDHKPLPAIEGLQILGEAYPGQEIQASGYSKNGTTHCGFEWVRHLQDGSITYIEGARKPTYIVSADDVDAYLAVEVQPLDDRQRKGELVKCFANDHKKISCHPTMIREIEKSLNNNHASFQLSLWKGSLDIWERATLEIKKSSYSIKLNGSNEGGVDDEKYTPATIVALPAEIPVEFSIIGPGGIERYLRTDYRKNDVSCSRDTIVLTMRLFIKRAIDRKLGKKKRRVLFFTK